MQRMPARHIRGRLNALDITMYMSLPSALFLLPPIFFVPHPAQWPGADAVTDWQVWKMVATLSPKTSIALLVSGWLAICNNLLQYWLVQRLSAQIGFACPSGVSVGACP